MASKTSWTRILNNNWDGCVKLFLCEGLVILKTSLETEVGLTLHKWISHFSSFSHACSVLDKTSDANNHPLRSRWWLTLGVLGFIFKKVKLTLNDRRILWVCIVAFPAGFAYNGFIRKCILIKSGSSSDSDSSNSAKPDSSLNPNSRVIIFPAVYFWLPVYISQQNLLKTKH